MSVYTATQTRISKIMQQVNHELYSTYGADAKSSVDTYLSSDDLLSDLSTLRDSLRTVMANFSDDINSHIEVHNAINEVLVVCEAVLSDAKIGNSAFFHVDATHTFYVCQSPEDVEPNLLYTTTADLASFIAAENACANWVNNASAGTDFYGSYNGDCAGADLLADPYSACLAGRDYMN